MRYLGWVLVGLWGCGLKAKLPEGPALTPLAREQGWSETRPAKVNYLDAPRLEIPIFPLLSWAAAYDLDLVVVSEHPDWDMHEYARLQTPQGPLWVVKEARRGTLDQTLIADLPEIDQWLPELPLQRRYQPVEVQDRSTSKELDISFRYQNIDGHPATLDYRGPWPKERLSKRNGSTMGHSRRQAMAVLDLPLRAFGGKAKLTVDGQPVKINKLLGILPFAMSLVQTQAGLAIGRYRLSEQDGVVWSTHFREELEIRQAWDIVEIGDLVQMVQNDGIRKLDHRFRKRGDSLELEEVVTTQFGRQEPTSRIVFSPALPDLRRRFTEEAISRWVMDVNGQQNHAIGEIHCRWTEDGPEVDLLPMAPWWVTDRPMRSKLRFDEAHGVQVEIQKEESLQIPTSWK